MQVDFFDFFRWVLGTVVGIYATIVTLQSLHGWYIFLGGRDKYITMLRRYVIVHGLRLRVKSFWGDVLICVILSVIFIVIAYAHHVVEDIDRTLHSPNHQNHPVAAALHFPTLPDDSIQNHARRFV